MQEQLRIGPDMRLCTRVQANDGSQTGDNMCFCFRSSGPEERGPSQTTAVYHFTRIARDICLQSEINPQHFYVFVGIKLDRD